MRWRKYLPWLAALLLIFLAFKVVGNMAWRFQEEPLQRVQLLRQDVVRAEIRFPSLVFSGHRQAATVNRQVKELYEAKTAAYKERAGQLLDEAEFNESLPQDQNQLYYAMDASFSVFSIGKEYLSLLLYEYEHIYGAPHPMISRHAYVFDTKSGELLSLQDVWGEDARERAVAEIYAQLESRGQVEDFYPGLRENLFFAIEENSWYMDEQNIYIIYNPYDIGPYALGIVEFALPK